MRNVRMARENDREEDEDERERRNYTHTSGGRKKISDLTILIGSPIYIVAIVPPSSRIFV